MFPLGSEDPLQLFLKCEKGRGHCPFTASSGAGVGPGSGGSQVGWVGFDSPTWAESITQGCLYWQQEKWVCFGHESTGLILLSVLR